MKSSFLEVNKCSSVKEKQNKKESNSNFKQNISKKRTKKEEKPIKQEKNVLPKSTTKVSLKKNKETSKKSMMQFFSNNNIQNNNKNTPNNKNMLKKNNKNNNLNDNIKKNKEKNHSKNMSSINLYSNNIPKSPSLTRKKSQKNDNNNCSKNHKISNNTMKSPEITKNSKGNKTLKKKNNNNVLKTNFGLLITNNHNNEGDSMFNDNESYFENNNLIRLNNGKRLNNKNNSIVEDYNTENYLSKVKSKKNVNSSLLNSIININRYLTNDANSKTISTINKDGNSKIKSKKIYDNQLDKIQVSKIINSDKSITNESKSDFLQDNKKKEKVNNQKNTTSINKNINSEYYCSYRTICNTNRIIKKRNSFNLDDCINKNNIFIDYILGYNTPRITINNKIIKDFRCSPKNNNYNNKTLINTDSDFKFQTKERIKVKLHQNNNTNQMSIIKAVNKSKIDLNEESTKSKSYKNNNETTGKKNLMKINEFQMLTEFDPKYQGSKNIANCNNIFDEEYYKKDTEINEYNLKERENQEFSENNTKHKKRKNNSSCISCIYSPINIHNKYNLSSQKGNSHNFNNSNNIHNNENYLKELKEEENNEKIKEIKIKLNNHKTRNKPRVNVYFYSPSFRSYEQNKKIEDNNPLNINSSYEKNQGKNNKVYTKQIFSNYNFNSKSKEKNRTNKDKINVESFNKFNDLKEDYINKKFIYSNPRNININNNVFQQNNFYTTNNYFDCYSKRIDSNKNEKCAPQIYVKPSKKKNNQTNIYLNCSPKYQNYSPKIVKEEKIKLKVQHTYNKYRTKAFIKRSLNTNNKENIIISNKIKSKVINNNLICKKYYDYFLNIKQINKPFCYISKEILKRKDISKFIKKSILQKPKPIICFITKINIHQFKPNFLQINSLDSKEQNIIKANILDFSIEQNKLNSNDTNNNKIIRYISNEKNYQESFGEINLSFSTGEINSFRQRENTIEGFFNELNINTDLISNNQSESKITFCPVFKNYLNINSYNNYETETLGRMINNFSNNSETERTEKNERTSFKRDEIIQEVKENINSDMDVTFKLSGTKNHENIRLNTEEVHLDNNNDINLPEKIFEKKLGDIKIKSEGIACSSKDAKSNEDKEMLNDIYPKKFNLKNFIRDCNNNLDENKSDDNSNANFNTITNNNNNKNKNDFIYLLNIITINNINDVNDQILKIIKLENKSINTFCVILKNKFNKEKKYSILYVLLCRKLLDELTEIEIKDNNSFNIINISKSYNDLTQLSTYQKYIFNLYKNILSNKIDNKKPLNFNCFNNFDGFNKKLLSLIKHDLSNYNIMNDVICFDEYKSFELNEIIQYYIEICIDNIYPNKLLCSHCNNYIHKLISEYSTNGKIKVDKNKINEIFLNIDNIIVDNKNMFEILGYLLYCMTIFTIFPIDNFNYFLNRDEFTIINLSKILKYTFLFCAKNNNKFPFEFKETKLFKNNSQIFEKYSY